MSPKSDVRRPYAPVRPAAATPDADLLAATTHVDIVNYLVLSTNYVSLQKIKALMHWMPITYFTSGWVAMRLPSKCIAVLSEASHTGNENKRFRSCQR